MSTPRNRYIKNNINNLMTNNQPKIISNTKSISKLKDYSDKNNCLRLIQINPFKSSDPPTSPIKTQNNLAFLANVKYGPKKLANINENSIEIPLKSMGKATLDCRALFGAKMNIIKSKKKQYNNEDNTISANNLENVKSMSFRNEYIIKFSNSAEYFNKLQKYAEFINNDKQSNFNELFLKMKSLFKNQNHLFFDKNYEENTKNEVKHSIIQYKKDKNSLPKINSAINSRDEIDLSIRKSKSPKINVEIINGTPYISVELFLEAHGLTLNKNIDYTSINDIQLLKSSAEEYIKLQVTSFLYKTSKKLNSDISGFGKYALSKYLTWEEWENANWTENYKNSFFNVNVNVSIISGGEFDKSP